MIDGHAHIGIERPIPDKLTEDYEPGDRFGRPYQQFIPLMDAVGIELAVLHCPRPWANKFHAQVVERLPDRFISVCKIDESRATTDEIHAELGACVEQWGFKGLYYDPGPTPSDASADIHTERYADFWRFVVSLRIPVSFVSYRQNFETLWPNLLALLDKFPDLTVMIVHGLYPACLLKENNRVVIPDSALKLVHNYDVQLDLLPGLRDDQYGPNDVVIKALFDTFGPSKLIWGSEFTKVKCPTDEQYAYQAHYIKERCAYMSKADLDLIHRRNAQRVYALQ